jgi:hypothetical protein
MDDLHTFVFGRGFEFIDRRVVSKLFATTMEGFTVDGVHTLYELGS